LLSFAVFCRLLPSFAVVCRRFKSRGRLPERRSQRGCRRWMRCSVRSFRSSSFHWPRFADRCGTHTMQMRGAPVPPAPPNKRRVLRPGLQLVFLPATAKLRPPQATGGTSHPRGSQHAGRASGRQQKNHKILGSYGHSTTTHRM
jgi:hypothetical protein